VCFLLALVKTALAALLLRSHDAVFVLLEHAFHFEDGLSQVRVIVNILFVVGWRGLDVRIAGASALAQDDRPSDAFDSVWRRALCPSRVCACRRSSAPKEACIVTLIRGPEYSSQVGDCFGVFVR
jgi:hypothetical protein